MCIDQHNIVGEPLQTYVAPTNFLTAYLYCTTTSSVLAAVPVPTPWTSTTCTTWYSTRTPRATGGADYVGNSKKSILMIINGSFEGQISEIQKKS
jgi:hypothetical protein